MSEKFIHLHSHSDASLQDGLFAPKKWAKAYKERGFIGAALTDHGSMTNSIAFVSAMKDQGLIPIVGSEVYYVEDPTKKTNDNRKASHLILLAKNYDGFVNLNKLMKLSFTDGYYYKNRIGLEWLKKHSEGLVCLTACQGGVLSQEVWKDFKGEDSDLIGRFKQFRDIFGKDLYVEFQGHNTISTLDDGSTYNSQAMINEQFYEKLRTIKGFQPIITNDCHYILPQHAKIQKMIKDLSWKQNNSGSADSATVTKDHFTDSLWMKNTKEVYQSFREHHEYLPKEFVRDGMMATMEVFEKCKDFEMPKGKRYLPKFRDKIDSKEFFQKYTKKLLIELIQSGNIHDDKKVYLDRYKKEFQVISSYNLEDYFLIVWDLVRFAKKEKIPIGLGRGSAAGCLVSYLLGIVRIDPIEHNLLFERFLNENRCVSGELPDIDLDFSSEDRNKIKKYIFDTYGREKVCEIGTYTRMMLKTAILDFNRALDVIPHADLLKITTKLDLEKEDAKDLDKAIESSTQLKTVMEKNKNYSFAVREIIGQMKSQSIHPAGVLICSEPIENITPLKTQKKTIKPEEREEGDPKEIRVLTTQSEDKYVIAQGLMKMDILGIKEYDVIKFVIENAPGFPYTLDNYDTEIMNLERKRPDMKIWKMFQAGKTQAVFQFASGGMQKLLQDMRPTKISDVIAANALYRPGCLNNGWHTLYINRKHGREEVKYPHPIVEKATQDTYGVIVYQEQFMEVIHKLGKISLVDTDTIRSALGKKDRAKLAKFKESFVKGAESEIGKKAAEELWNQIEQSSEYSFNKSHSAAYGVLAYISQWLKVYYPAHFWAGQIYWDVKKGDLNSMMENKRAAQEMGIDFRYPDINRSGLDFKVIDVSDPLHEITGSKKVTQEVLWSLRAVKGVGLKAAQEIVKHQPFKSFEDFYKRVNKRQVNFKVVTNLIYAGCFDDIGDRKDLLKYLAKAAKKEEPKVTSDKLLTEFYRSMGFYEQSLKKIYSGFSHKCITEKDLAEFCDKDTVVVGGIISAIKPHKTKKGDKMGFLTLEDMDERIEITCFPEAWETHRKLLKVNNIVEIIGKKSEFGGKNNSVQLEAIKVIKESDD